MARKNPGGVALKPLKDPMRDPSDAEILLALAARGASTMARTLMFDLELDFRNPLIRQNGQAVKRMKSLLTAGTVEKATPITYRLTEKGREAMKKRLAVTEEELAQTMTSLGDFSDGPITRARFAAIAKGLLERYTLTQRG